MVAAHRRNSQRLSRGVRQLFRLVGHDGTPGSGVRPSGPATSPSPAGRNPVGAKGIVGDQAACSPSRKAVLPHLLQPFPVAAQPPDVGPGAILRDPVEVLRARSGGFAAVRYMIGFAAEPSG
jgi:hypothetical protein